MRRSQFILFLSLSLLFIFYITSCERKPLRVASEDIDYYSVSVDVASYTGDFVISLNGNESLTITGTGPYTFSNPIADSSAYNVYLTQKPAGKLCFVQNGSGVVSGGDVTGITIDCPNSYFMGGVPQGNPISYSDQKANTSCMGGWDLGPFNQDYYQDGTGCCPDTLPTVPSGCSLFFDPACITNDGTNLYVCDTGNYVLRTINISSLASSTIAGSVLTSGTSDGTGASASFTSIRAITYDGSGSLYVADEHTIRRVDTSTYTVTTIAGSFGSPGSNDGNGTAARFNSPEGITNDGTYLYVTDAGNCTIRRIDINTLDVTTIAGSPGSCADVDAIGSNARFTSLSKLTTDGIYLYITESTGNIRRLFLATGGVDTFVTGLTLPRGLTTDGTGLYVTGWNGNFYGIDITTSAFTEYANTEWWNNTDITFDGTRLFVVIAHYNTIESRQ